MENKLPLLDEKKLILLDDQKATNSVKWIKKKKSIRMGIKVEIMIIFFPKRTEFLNINFLDCQTYFFQIKK